MQENTRILRPAQAVDLPILVHLLGVLFGIEKDFSAEPAKQQRGLELLMADNRAVVMVAEEQGQVRGLCTAQILISTAEGGPAVVVEDLVVLPDWQGRGIGRNLLAAVKVWAVDRGVRRLQLLADRNNSPALAFYKQMGWTGTELICLRTFVTEDCNDSSDSFKFD
jgi:GNAT superfamily N-acetyltransferase